MLSKQLNFVIPSFNIIKFVVNFTTIIHICIANNYNYFVILNEIFFPEQITLLKKYNKYFLKSISIHWFRVAFKGKGYRLRKFKNASKITLNFGHSHWTKLLITDNYFFKKLKRQNYLCFAKSYFTQKVFKFYIKFIKKLNCYTKRGLRLKKQYIRKRFGKISQVVSSLH